ncbi:MAG: hypothetical protein LC642_07095 [Verrucomicrobiaceae bacterium]|nr:hypothetical protein [Verrucomicrobiaceae bacterium]
MAPEALAPLTCTTNFRMNAPKLFFISLLLATPGKAQEAPIVTLDRALTPIVRTHFPDAQIQVTETSYVAKFGTMDFTVDARQKTGEILAKTHIEEGPNFEGFILRIELQEGRRYLGALRIPQDTPQPYWSTFLDSRTVSKDRHFFIRFSYGSRLRKEFKKAILDALPKSRPNT